MKQAFLMHMTLLMFSIYTLASEISNIFVHFMSIFRVMKIPDVLENLEITEQNFLIVLCATVVIVVLFVSFFLVKTKNKLNW